MAAFEDLAGVDDAFGLACGADYCAATDSAGAGAQCGLGDCLDGFYDGGFDWGNVVEG